MQVASFALLLCLGVAVPSAALAQSNVTPLSESLTGESRQAYDAGKLLFEDGDPAGAITKFKRAYELSKDPRLLWNMAVCEKEARHYASAARLVARYLNEGGNRLTPENRSNAEATRDALRGFYSELTLKALPAGARVTIDDVSVAPALLTAPIPVDLGQRRVRVELEGYEAFERAIDVPGATPVELQVTLTKAVHSASLSVASSGKEDVISLDGKAIASGHWQGTVTPGEHVVRVTGPGKKPYEVRFQLANKASRSLQVSLEDEAKRGGALWPWLVGGAAVAVGAGIGGYFLLKPEDKQAPMPDGKLGTIYIPLLH